MLIAASVVCLAALLKYTYRSEFSVPEPNEAIAQQSMPASLPVPIAEFTSLDGQPFLLDKLRGRVILLNFWASWCPPCVKEFPSMIRLVKQMKGKLALVAVSNDPKVSSVTKFLSTLPFASETFTENKDIFILFDNNGKVTSEQFAVFRFPESYVIDQNHVIARKLVGEVDWLQEGLVSYFHGLANGKFESIEKP